MLLFLNTGKRKRLSIFIPKWRVVLLLHTQFGTYVWSLVVVNIRHIVRSILATICLCNGKEIVTIVRPCLH